jgi:hypothetical protein
MQFERFSRKTFRDCSDWASLFKDGSSQCRKSASSCPYGIIFPNLSRPNSRFEEPSGTFRKVPPSTPIHSIPGDLGDPAMEELRQQWNWQFSSHKAMIQCSNCQCVVTFKLLEGHLQLCKKGPKLKLDVDTSGSIRHDKDYVPNNQKKPWIGPLDEDPSFASRPNAKLRIFSSGPGQDFVHEEFSVPFGFDSSRSAFFNATSSRSTPRSRSGASTGTPPWTKANVGDGDRVQGIARDSCRAGGDSDGAATERQRRACDAYEAAYRVFESAARRRQARPPPPWTPASCWPVQGIRVHLA